MLKFHWFLPTSGDGHEAGAATVAAGAAKHTRQATIGYLGQVARAAEQAGFASVLTPVGAGCPDPWIVCTAVAQHTTRLGFLVAFRAGFALPTVLAQQAEAFDLDLRAKRSPYRSFPALRHRSQAACFLHLPP